MLTLAQRFSRGEGPTAVARSPLKAQRLQHQRSSGQKTQYLSFPPHHEAATVRHNDIQLDACINQGRVYVSNRIAAHQQPQSAPLLVSAQLSRPASRSAGAGRSAQFCRKGSRPRFTDPGHRSSRRIPSMPQVTPVRRASRWQSVSQ